MHEKELYAKLVIYKDYTELHGQQNIKNDCLLISSHYYTDFMYDTYLHDILVANLWMALLKELKYSANIVNKKG